MEETEVAHLAGAFDTAGSITVQINKNDSYAIGYQFRPILRLQRPGGDEDPLIGKLMAFCEEQGVKYSISKKSHGADRDTQSVEWSVKDKESIERFLKPLIPHLVTEYVKAAIMLDEILPRIEDGFHQERETFYELMEYADKLREANRGPSVKYDQEYFEEEWDLASAK